MTQGGQRDDDYEAYERPGRRSNRPRTKDRPDYADADIGMIITVDRGRYRVLIADRDVSATKARQVESLSRTRLRSCSTFPPAQRWGPIKKR